MAIASCLVDTNILLRMTRRSDPQHKIVDRALARLAGQGTTLCYTLQNIAELWNAMTRPVDRNGLGLSVAETEREVRAIEAGMDLLPDTSGLQGMAEDCGEAHRFWGSGSRCALGSGHVCSWREPYPHSESGGLQPV